MTFVVKDGAAIQTHAHRPFSSAALEQLSAALHGCLAASNVQSRAHLHEALGRMCGEAHERGRGLKPMLAAVRDAWPSMPRGTKDDVAFERVALDRVLRQSLTAYYGGSAP